MKTRGLSIALFLTALFCALLVNANCNHETKLYAHQPGDCPHGWTGWATSTTYRGGITNGGITMATAYECNP